MPKLPSKLKPILFKTLIALAVLIPLAIGGFWVYTRFASYSAEEFYLNKALNDPAVEITTHRRYYQITPQNLDSQNTPIIYYTGGLVDSESYLFQMAQISQQLQTEVFLSRPVFNAMIFEINLSDSIIRSQNLDKIQIGGHSLGGISGCRYAKNNPEKVERLFLLGSYCDQDLSQLEFEVLSIMGKRDGIINQENYQKAKANLPAGAVIIEDEKLNHSDFGNYGLQDGDEPSKLEVMEVVEMVVEGFGG